MEDFRRFLPSSPDMISNANACSRALGAPSKCAVSSFAHYSEIFGNFFASKSSPVPILDYPLLDDDQVAPGVSDTKFEYADIFGSVHAGDYDGSYEPVVAENSRPGCFPTKLSSRDVKGTRQQKVVANSKNYHALSIANSQHNCGEAKGTRDLSQDSVGTVEEVDHFEETVSECPVEKSHKDPQADYIQHDYKLGDPKNATVSNHSLPNSLANHTLQSESKENPGGVLNASDCDPTIGRDQNSSCNPFSFSTSGKDTTSHVNVFLTVTDIDLRTDPSVLPPPLRPPPKLDSPRQMKVHQDEWNLGKPLISTDGYHLGFGCKTPALEVICENESSPLSHVVEDLSSTAAPSADAIREAVDKAKAKLKSAKESLERTRVNYCDCMKHGLYEDKKINERKKSGSVKESLVLLDDEAQGASCIRTNELKEYLWEKKRDVIGIGCSDLRCEENMGHIELRKESLCKSQEDSCRSLNTHKLEHGTAETNANKQFYELVNNESFEGILKWDTDETNSRPSGRILLHKQKIRELNVIDKNEKLRMVDETNEQVNDCILKGPEGACRYKAGDILIEATQDSGQMEEYKNKVAAEAPEQEEEREWKSRTVAHRHTYDEKRLNAVHKHEGKKRLEADSEHVDDGIRLNVADKNEDSFNSLKTAIKHEEVQKPKAAGDYIEEKRLTVTQRHKEEERRLKAATNPSQGVKGLKATSVHTEEEKTLNAAFGFERGNEMMKAAREHEVVEIRLKASCGNPWEEKGETTTPLPEMVAHLKDDHVVEESNGEAANEGLGSEECDAKVVPHEWIEVETKLRSALETHIDGEHEKKTEAAGQLEERVKLEEMMKQGHGYYLTEESLGMRNRNEKPEEIYDTHKIQHPRGVEGNENAVETAWKVYKGSDHGVMKQEAKGVKLQVHEVQILKQARQVHESEAIENKRNSEENEENCKKVNAAKRVLLQEAGKCKEFSDSLNWEHHEKAQNTARTVQELERNENKLKLVKEAFEVAISDKCSSEFKLAYDMEKSNSIEKSRDNTKEAEVRIEEVDPLDSCLNSGDKSFKTAQVTTGQDREREDKTTSRIYEKEKEKEERIQREREREKERLRKIEEEIKREREREKNKIALERTELEASARVLVQAQERPEKASLDKVTTEAQRGLTEAQEGAKETSFDDARLKVETAEKASSDVTRLRAERAAVERAVAEARQRAAEKLMAQRTAATYRTEGEPQKASDFHGTEDQLSLRCRARLERHQRIVERAAKALAEKNVRDILAQREQAERNRLAETLDADVRRWSSGKEGNLRALLSTLQYVLGPESGWQPISLTDVLTAAAVKKAYRKATLCVHPDKLQQRGVSIPQKYICEKVFDLLKDAWNKFNSEER